MFKIAIAFALVFAESADSLSERADSEACMAGGCESEDNLGLSLLQHKAEQKKVHREDPAVEETGGEEDPSHWNYVNPAEWGKGFPDCAGNAQSPINIELTATQASQVPEILEIAYEAVDPATLKVTNNGHSIQVNGAFGRIRLPDGWYRVLQFHFHCPSEHAVGGNLLPCEMHIVHQKEDSSGTDDLAVIGILMREWSQLGSWKDASEQLQFLKRLGFGKGTLPQEGQEVQVTGNNPVDLSFVFAEELAGHYWHYRGSLTTPPCSETVHWYVLQNAGAISTGMINEFKGLFPDPANNRPVQQRNSRTILVDGKQIDATEFPAAR